jgi:hypothetical protein
MSREKTRSITIAVLWVVSLGVVVVPGGVLTQIWQADSRFNNRVSASPFGKLCYLCNAPAVYSAEYSDGSTRYFCKDHHPPSRMQGTTSGEKGGKDYDPWLWTIFFPLIFGVNILRAFVQPFLPWRRFCPSLPGAVVGVVFAGAAWGWFTSL